MQPKRTVRAAGAGATSLPGAIFWDMDGTLVDTEPLWDIALERWTARIGTTMTPELRESTMGNSLPNALRKVYAAAGIPVDQQDRDGDARWLHDAMAEQFAAGIPWCPGAEETLDRIGALGIPMLLVTNTERELADVALRVIGLDRFTTTVCGDEVPEGKPEPDIYLRAAELVGLEPSRALAIEDSPTGVAAATAAGCPTLVVSGRDGGVRPGNLRTFRDGVASLTAAEIGSAWAAEMVPAQAWETGQS
ncbi:HAD family hydrolase [Jongsikchunia kroppenstedtii]|uniref:HAD family hydrolase n=1 Tax=Jongsikchunia kroppenstedtii TaxID=1121721 RepID=UPI0003611E5A|nr:HAD family phosphatase [Jongsikchunia kroppenstedtii]